jgi:hypothetical protein
MATTQSPGTCSAFRIPRPEPFRQVASGPMLIRHLGELCELDEIDISPEEYRELSVLDDFLTSHVRPNRIYTLQCMMLWNEWVRTFMHRTHSFPKRGLEKECREAIAGRFGIGIAMDSSRGPVYPGLRFVA